jgi:antitoxin HicB
MSKKHMGSSIDDFLKKENIFEEAQAQAIKEVVAWQLAKAMKKKKISKARMAVLLKTSRSQVDRILRSATLRCRVCSGASGAAGGG